MAPRTRQTVNWALALSCASLVFAVSRPLAEAALDNRGFQAKTEERVTQLEEDVDEVANKLDAGFDKVANKLDALYEIVLKQEGALSAHSP